MTDSWVDVVAEDLTLYVQHLVDNVMDRVQEGLVGCEYGTCDSQGFVKDDDDEPAWRIVFEREGFESVDLTFTITTEEAREGEGDGVGLLLDAVKAGGEIVASWCPFNHTGRVWVRPTDHEPLADLRRRLGVDDDRLEILAGGLAARIVDALRTKDDDV